jgi:hypothetical protein
MEHGKKKREMYGYGGSMKKKKMMGGGRVQYAHGGKAHKSIQDMEKACKQMAGSNYHDEG